jgi:multisubunit Na+/H+ antiporter MnhE subunit
VKAYPWAMVTTALLVGTFVAGAVVGAALLFLCAALYCAGDPRSVSAEEERWREALRR